MDAEPTSARSTEAAIQAAGAFVGAGNFRAAVDILAEALRSDPENAALLRLRGYYLSFLHRLPEAEALCRRAVAIAPEDPVSLRLLGSVLTQIRRKRPEALRILLEAVRLGHHDGWCHFHLGVLRAAMLRPRYAGASFAAACERSPEEPVILATAAEYAFARYRVREGSLYAARAFQADPANAHALAAEARSRLLSGRREEALDLARASLAIDASYSRAIEVLAEAEMGRRWDRAIWSRVRAWSRGGRLRGTLLLYVVCLASVGATGVMSTVTDLSPAILVSLLPIFLVWAFLPLKRIERRIRKAAKPFVLDKRF